MAAADKTRQFFRSRLPLILGLYLLIQPLLDVLTTLSASAGQALSAGVVVRTLFMAFAFLYVVFVSRFEGKRWALIYLWAIVAYVVLFMALMFRLGGIGLCLSNLKELVKVFFVPVAAVFLFAIYREHGHRLSSRSIAWAGALYAFVILFAFLTGTSLVSYRSGFGYKGWFYAANEVGCIIAIAAPVIIWYCLKQLPTVTGKTWWKGVLIALALASVVFSADYIGTKIIFAVVLVYCVLALLWCLVAAFRERVLASLARVGVMLAMVLAIVILFFSSPLNGYMSNVYLDLIDTPSEDVLTEWGEPEETDPDVPYITGLANASQGTWLRELIANNGVVQRIDQLLSRRLMAASPAVQEFIDGSVATKLLGVGYANSAAYAREVSRMIEMDGIGLLVRQGAVGFLLYFVPYLLGMLYLIVEFFKHPLKRLSCLKYCSYLYAALVAFAISMVAGHVLGAPAVGTFMLAVTVNLFLMTREQNRNVDIEVLD